MSTGEGFGELLRRHRRAARITQRELSERSGVSVDTIGALERGLRTAPRRATVMLLGSALGLGAEERDALVAAARGVRRQPAGNAPGAPLPFPPEPLIGRERELAAAVAVLRSDSARLVTLTGVGGVGKTHLARAALELAGDAYQPAAFVDLAAVTRPPQVGPAIQEALRLHDAPGREPEQRLTEYLSGRRALLVLDNFEHLVPASVTVACLLERCPDLRILVTSRVPLGVRGEHVLHLPTLAVPDRTLPLVTSEVAAVPAIALFLEHADAAGTAFVLTEENVEAVAEICRRLEGLPLALELAAPWLRLLTPQDLLGLLDRQLSILEGGPDLPERQRTLSRTLEWSYDLLPQVERRLFRSLAVFAGRFELADVERVCADGQLTDENALRGLGALVDASLVARTRPGDGFRLLEPVRHYAAELLSASGEEDDLRARHAQHFLALAEAAHHADCRPPEAAWLRRLEAAHRDLRVALGWYRDHQRDGWVRMALALGGFWMTYGHLSEGRQWVAGVLEAGLPDPADRWRALCLLASLVARQGDPALAARLAGESIEVARALGDEAAAGWARTVLGNVHAYAGEFGPARAALEEVLATATDEDLRLDSLVGLGDLLLQEGRLTEARRLVEPAVELAARHESPWQAGRARLLLGIAAHARGDDELTRSMVVEAVGLLYEAGNWYGLAGALDLCGALAVRCKEPERALRLSAAAASLREMTGVSLGSVWLGMVRQLVIEPARASAPASADLAWAQGSRLSVQDAVAYAVELLSAGDEGGGLRRAGPAPADGVEAHPASAC